MSCKVHALCADHYAGMVDVGEATADPVSPKAFPVTHGVYLSGQVCCVCGEPATYYLEAQPDRFAITREDGTRVSMYCHHDRDMAMHSAAAANARTPRVARLA